jgi:hypothetical protein
MSKTVVITQSNYLPWRGYFDLLRSADEAVLLDCVQYTRSDWRNRNLIKTARGLRWLTIPIRMRGRSRQAIDEAEIATENWAERHLRAIDTAYKNARFYSDVRAWVFAMLRAASSERMLSKVNERTLKMIIERLGIRARLRSCVDIIPRGELRNMGATERLIEIATALGADRYLTGPKARDYLDADKFKNAGIEISWMNYGGYSPYRQLWCGFEPNVSIIDLLFNVGPQARQYLDRE